ncbi:hypothetical protein KDW_01850 [Dictyobacter vulcani]|uniref:Uncharacterized protein n=1 Tax=Dictyobacter vulcani TaxID=2607529 RepID=A0A5J4KEQ1_9CHLR|nr:hypothetical protein [Dictyobacter vulcani]GER86023.1 hypothetical protein KDW_01850 [Dictyobacter vulcani]
MQQKLTTANIKVSPISFSLKCGSILLLLLLSTMIVACGANSDTTNAADAPQPVATINLNGSKASPTPAIPPQSCGVWLENASPNFSAGGVIPLYAKFTLNKDGNPQGIAQAGVTFTVHWGDGTAYTAYGTTGSDGLAVASVPMLGHAAAVYHLSLITATFSSGNVSCAVDDKRPQSFVLINGAKPKGPIIMPGGGGGKPGKKPGN